MFGRGKRAGLLVAITALAIALPTSVAAAETPPSPTGTVSTTPPYSTAATTAHGVDVSWPQCDAVSTLPAHAFAVVGVNKGLANTTNPCLTAELKWAAQSTGSPQQRNVALYVNIGNPGSKATWWPTSNVTQFGAEGVANPNGACVAGSYGTACSYVYGYSMAREDAQTRLTSGDPSSFMWWVDVETSNTWQKSTRLNAASISGMVAYFRGIKAPVGLYSTPSQWKTIAGTTAAKASIAGLPSWHAGATSSSSASSRCGGAPLVPGGRISMVQWISSTDLDYNYSCNVLSRTPKPKISGTAKVGKTVKAVAGSWTPSPVKLTYAWKVNGKTISAATKITHKIAKSEAGKKLTVTVTGSKKSYGSIAVTSSASKKVAK